MPRTGIMSAIQTYDTTLRDGEQCEGISLSLKDKLLIARALDDFGIDVIEGGFPASNPKDAAFFKAIAEDPFKHAKLAGFGSTCKKGVQPSEDGGLRGLLECGAPVVTIVGKAWDEQVTRALQASLEENLRMIGSSVRYLKDAGRYVVFDAEHYFDGFASNRDYALACVREASQAGADCICLCETNGGALPFDVEAVVAATAAELPGQALGVHCHNDSGCAVANSLAAVRAGAVQVQGTVNGLGERVGNTDLLTVIADAELKMGVHAVGPDRLRGLTRLSHYVAEVAGVSVPDHHPYSGRSAFSHKGGLHASAISRFPQAYEHADPSLVGNDSRMVVSELAGKASLARKAAALGIDLAANAERLQAVLDDVKSREARGYTYETADGSLALLILRHIGEYEPAFKLESWRVIVDDREDTGALAKDAASEATVKIWVGSSRFIATGEGAGPVGALDAALRMGIERFYPEISGMELTDYKVRLPDESEGTDALTRVTITTEDSFGTFGTVGVSENVLEASWNALVESYEYGLIRFNERNKASNDELRADASASASVSVNVSVDVSAETGIAAGTALGINASKCENASANGADCE